jgi:type I restriction enzyme M protein
MANRPVFLPKESMGCVQKKCVDFTWSSGFAVSQKQKSITSLHENAKKKFGVSKILDISSKSEDPLGVALSAFNLKTTTLEKGITFSVETAFQSSKVFKDGGPFLDLLGKSSKEAKKDPRIRNSGALIGFRFCNANFPLYPKTIFYDWLYINTLLKNAHLKEQILKYEAFTDIEFNPKKSINCQAFSVALFCLLHRAGKLNYDSIEFTPFKSITTAIYSKELSNGKYCNLPLFS